MPNSDTAAARARVFLTQTPFTPQIWGGSGLSSRFSDLYRKSIRQPYLLTDSAVEADIILYCEDYQETEQVLCPKLRSEQTVFDYPEKVFVLNFEDRPIGFLPGVYVSMPRSRFDDQRFRTGAYFGDINPLISTAEAERETTARQYLFSFIGARTAPVRGSIFGLLASTPRTVVVETGNQQFNVCVDDPAKRSGQMTYLKTALESSFVLCPRGYGASSFRLFETMRLARVPVILADDWVAPEGPAWPDCSVRIAERKVGAIPDIDRCVSSGTIDA